MMAEEIPAARWVQAVERLKANGYTPWMSADELAVMARSAEGFGKDLLRELELLADHLGEQNGTIAALRTGRMRGFY